MSFSIQEFKSKAATKGFLKTHSYEFIVTPVSLDEFALQGSSEIAIRTESFTLPGFSFMSVDNYRPYGMGKSYSIPYTYNPTELNCIHTVDSDGSILQTFHEWGKAIFNFGKNENINMQFAAGYLKDYAVNATLNIYDNNIDKLVKKIVFQELFPSSVDQVPLSWGDNDSTMKLSVNYRYTYYTME